MKPNFERYLIYFKIFVIIIPLNSHKNINIDHIELFQWNVTLREKKYKSTILSYILKRLTLHLEQSLAFPVWAVIVSYISANR